LNCQFGNDLGNVLQISRWLTYPAELGIKEGFETEDAGSAVGQQFMGRSGADCCRPLAQ
jgi:hypothetical protein